MGSRRPSTSQRPVATGDVRLQVSLRRAVAFGPGKARLLEAIGETGSITAAAHATGMSYRRAWGLVVEMNDHFHSPLVNGQAGGLHGGGARLTDHGRSVLAMYRDIVRRIGAALEEDVTAFGRLLASSDGTASSAPSRPGDAATS